MKFPFILAIVALLVSCGPIENTENEAVESRVEPIASAEVGSDISTADSDSMKDIPVEQSETEATTDETDPAEVQTYTQNGAPVEEAKDHVKTAVSNPTSRAAVAENETRTGVSAITRQEPDAAQTQIPNAQDVETPSEADLSQRATAAWGQLLSGAVSESGKVNYTRILEERNTLDQFLAATSDGPPAGSLAARAYWINQYNAYTIRLIIDNWPVRSIKDLHDGNPWDVQWITIGEQTLSLNQIEFEQLRPGEEDARIHFAVNCAAASCPPLHNELFTADNTNSKLESLAIGFVNNPSYNVIDKTPWQLSSIFDWYGEDFRDVEFFIMDKVRGELDAPGDVEFLEYDWSLND